MKQMETFRLWYRLTSSVWQRGHVASKRQSNRLRKFTKVTSKTISIFTVVKASNLKWNTHFRYVLFPFFCVYKG